jgi:hypothetical protein
MLTDERKDRIATFTLAILLIIAGLFAASSIISFAVGSWIWAFATNSEVHTHIQYFKFSLASAVTIIVMLLITGGCSMFFNALDWLDNG